MNIRFLILPLALFGCPDNLLPPPTVKPSDTGDMRRDALPKIDTKLDIADIGPVNGALVRTPLQEGVARDGHPDVETPLANGEARAGKLSTDGGFKGVWAHCKPNDFKLYNSKVEFCIQGVETNRYEFFRGGLLVDARQVGDPLEDEFDLFSIRKDLEVFSANDIFTVRDGSDGEAAVVRVEGTDLPIAHFVGAIGETSFRRFNSVEWTVEYRLKPDAEYVEIVSWLSDDDKNHPALDTGDVIGFGDRFEIWAPVVGFESTLVESTNYVIGHNEHQTIAMVSPEPTGQFFIPIGDVPWFMGSDNDVSISMGEEYARLRWLIVTDNLTDTNRIRQTLVQGPETLQQLVIRRPNGGPVVNRRVEVLTDLGEPHALAETNDAGVLEFYGEAGTYAFVVDPIFGAEAETVTLEVPAEIVLDPPGTLDAIIDVEGSPIAAKVTISKPNFSESYIVDPGNPTPLIIEPGQYRITIDKGMEYDFIAADMTIVSGQSTKIVVTLNRVMDTENYFSADFHQHLEPSIDSDVKITDRVLDNVGQGVEFVTPTDHEVITDLSPYIVSLGLGDVISTMPGIEVSPTYGHTNLFPMQYRRNERARGSIPLAVLDENGEPKQRPMPEILDIARAHPSNPIIQINHGRGSSGYFESVNLDPTTNPLLNDDPRYSPEYDAMEVINDWDTTCDLFNDWAAHLNIGRLITATGNSDSHSVFGQSGYPRNYLYMPTASLGAISEIDVKEAMLNRRVSVAGNVFVDFTDGKIPGDVVTVAPNVPTPFSVRVQTPTFALADTLLVILNGFVVDEIDLVSVVTDVVDFEGEVDVTTDVDAWVSFVALGPDIDSEVHNRRHVLGFTNAVILNADGDDIFTPPGPLNMSFSAIDKHGLCQ